MKILIINKYLYPKGGDAISAVQTGRLLEKKGHRVMFWGMRSIFNKPFPHWETFIPYVDLNEIKGWPEKLKATGRLLYSIDAKKKIAALLAREKPDLVHLHNFAHQISPSIIDVLKQAGIPCVMTMHDYKLVCAAYTLLAQGKPCELCGGGRYYYCALKGCVKNSRLKSMVNTLEMYLHHRLLNIYDHIHQFISPSFFMQEKLLTMGFRRKIVVLPNFIDPQEYAPEYGGREASIVYIGRLSTEKGLLTLIEAARRLPRITVKLIGAGPQRTKLESAVDTSRLRNVRLLGYLSGPELHRQIAAAQCVIIPSEWYENNPRVIIESFALGKAVIGSRIGGIPELITDGRTGLTFTPGSAQDLADKISYALSDEARLRQWGRNARDLVENRLHPERHYTELMKIYYETLLSKR